jgi:RNA 2',3'-cyclic 3'-phosphodiesterase
VRLFVAGPLPELLQESVLAHLAVARRAAPQARWVQSGELHLTLAFLGETPAADVAGLVEQLAPVGQRHPALPLTLRGAGVFGPVHHPTVLFAELAGDTPGLQALATDVRRTLGARPLGTPSLEKPFHPHLTLARARARGGDTALRRCHRFLRALDLGEFLLDRLVLFRSDLQAVGRRHTPVAEFPLAAGQSAHV